MHSGSRNYRPFHQRSLLARSPELPHPPLSSGSLLCILLGCERATAGAETCRRRPTPYAGAPPIAPASWWLSCLAIFLNTTATGARRFAVRMRRVWHLGYGNSLEGTYAGFERPECIGEPHRGHVRPNVEASMKIRNLHRLSPLPRRPVKQSETCKMRVFYRLIGKG